ncbi:MAG: PA2779 family protein [Nitrospiraceae bacterium]
MQMILRYAKHVSYLLIIAMTLLSLPHHQVRAAMVGTEAVIEAESGVSEESISSDRARIEALQQREKARAQLEAYGISADAAQAWVESLTESEVAMVADKLDQLPPGGEEISIKEALGGILAVLWIGALVLSSVALLAL